MKRAITTVFLDIDGTLSENFHIHTKGWEAILLLIGKKIDTEFFQSLHGADTETAIRKVSDQCHYELSNEDLKIFVKLKNLVRDYEISKLSSESLFPGVVSFLQSLKQNNVTIVCCSISNACHLILAKLGVIDFFDDYICGKNMSQLKSDSPACFVDYINEKGLQSSSCLVIDDDVDVLLNLRDKTDIQYLGVGNKLIYGILDIPFISDYSHVLYNDLCIRENGIFQEP